MSDLTQPIAPSFPFALVQSGIPFGQPSSGSIANNGALSGLTAFPVTYSDIWLYFPAAAIVAGSAAGLYYCQMSSTTAGTIFNNPYVSGPLAIPTSPVAFVTTGPGAYVQSTGALNGVQLALPAGVTGLKGRLRLGFLSTNNNSAGTKVPTVSFGGTVLTSASNTTNVSSWQTKELLNRGKTGGQIAPPTALQGPGSTAANSVYPAVDTTQGVTIGFNFNNNTATDWQLYEYHFVEVFPG